MKKYGLVALVVVALALLLALALRSRRVLVQGLPERVVCASNQDAATRAAEWAATNGGTVTPVLGTGSMAPFIPPAPTGIDPLAFVAAYAVITTTPYAEISKGALCVYRPTWANGKRVMHSAAERDGGGWIMSGLANARSESFERMTSEKFDGIATRVFIWDF